MNLLQILAKFFNIPNVGNTPQNNGQCTGLVNKYVESLGLPHLWGDAKDLMEGADTNTYAITPNDPTDTKQFPQAGSIMVWGDTWGNGDGHTGVVIFADGTKFACLEQNMPFGHAPQVLMHDYQGVKGWITPKNLPDMPTQKMLDACMADRDNFWKQRDDLSRQLKEQKTQLDEANGKLTTFTALGYTTIDDITKALDDKDKTIVGLQTELQQCLAAKQSLAELVKKKDEEDSTAIELSQKLQLENAELQRQIKMLSLELQTKPTANAILTKIDNIRRWAAIGENLTKRQTIDDAVKSIEKQVPSSSGLLTAFLGIFGIGGEDKK